MRFISIIGLLLISLCITGCQVIYHPDVVQGNILTEDKIHSIKRGMSIYQVNKILGNPILIDPYNADRLVYAYTLYPRKGKIQQRYMVIYFQGGRVNHFVSKLPPAEKPKTNSKMHGK